MSSEQLTSDLLINCVGLSEPPELEEQNARKISLALNRVRGALPYIEREILYNEVVPALVEAFKKQRAVNGPAHQLLQACSSSPHFLRYAKDPAAKDLHKVAAKRLLDGAWLSTGLPFEYELETVLQFLSTFLVVWGTDLDEDIRKRLVEQLETWNVQYRYNPHMQDFTERCLHILNPTGAEGVDMHTRQLPYMRQRPGQGIDSCKFSECRTGSTSLMACSRCKLRYCCADHQREDWRDHKPFCVSPSF